jgi:hypothetical protein
MRSGQYGAARDPNEAEWVLVDELPKGIAAVLYPGELGPLLQRLRALPKPSARPRLTGEDWLGRLLPIPSSQQRFPGAALH